MKIIAHRGKWKKEQEKNTFPALHNALISGYGIETDIRDYMGKLVISHDIAESCSVKFKDILESYSQSGCNTVLALNVKSDGIQKLLLELLRDYGVSNYFLFDMSIPEMVVYKRMGMCYFTRHSDIERECVLYENALGVWMDAFYQREWITYQVIEDHLRAKKEVVLVSPELHGWEYITFWNKLKEWGYDKKSGIYLCTDYPDEARAFMEDKEK